MKSYYERYQHQESKHELESRILDVYSRASTLDRFELSDMLKTIRELVKNESKIF